MPRIAMIGAESVVFCKTLMMDIMATEGLHIFRNLGAEQVGVK